MKLAFITTDNRQHFKDFSNPRPYFGPAPEALLQGLVTIPNLEIHIVSCARQKMNSPAKLADNVWFHSLHVPKIGWMRTAYQGCIRAVRRKIREIQPDIVHGQGTELDCAMDAVFSGYPNVVTLHGNMGDSARIARSRIGSFFWCAARLEDFALKRTAGVVCISTYTQALARPRTPKTWVVPNALREAFFTQPVTTARGQRRILLHVGVVCENKRQLEMLEVARSLHRKGLDFELLFVGDANPARPYTKVFLDQIQEAARQGYARHATTKSVTELIGRFDQASALVHTPSAEAFGLVVAEALARGLRFFGFRVGGIPDILEGAEGVVSVAPDDWTGLANALESWLRAKPSEVLPASALMRERYHPAVVARQHISVYEEVLGTAG